jgi:hypothetical protein
MKPSPVMWVGEPFPVRPPDPANTAPLEERVRPVYSRGGRVVGSQPVDLAAWQAAGLTKEAPRGYGVEQYEEPDYGEMVVARRR